MDVVVSETVVMAAAVVVGATVVVATVGATDVAAMALFSVANSSAESCNITLVRDIDQVAAEGLDGLQG